MIGVRKQSAFKPNPHVSYPPTTIRRIGSETYIVNASFNGKSGDDLGSRLARLIRDDLERNS